MTYLLVMCYQLTPEFDREFPPLLTVPYAVESATRRAGSNCYVRVLKPAGRGLVPRAVGPVFHYHFLSRGQVS